MLLTELATWKALESHYQIMKPLLLKQLFKGDPSRAEQFSLQAADLFLDYSKNRITQKTLSLLLDLAKSVGLKESIDRFFAGEAINFTEQRAALHPALRQLERTQEIQAIHKKMALCVKKLQQQRWLGYSGLPITDVVNIGIGGSDLGPRLCCDALAPYRNPTINIHFVANIDGYDLYSTLKDLNPETTLFIVASKSFTTTETLINATTAKDWLLESTPAATNIQQHFIAVTAQPTLAEKFGIVSENIFAFWEWVGGRFSLWSSIGLPIAIALGMDHFRELLAGADAMDQHFRTAELHQNMPVIMGLLSVWYINFFHAQTQAIIPYDQRLKLFPAYLQQLEMESNGKSINKEDEIINYATAPIIWGDVGVNGQHAFHQLLHQGTVLVPIDFLIAKKPAHPYQHQHELLIANCLAQSEALMFGLTEEEVLADLSHLTPAVAKKLVKHKQISGNKPSNTLIFPELSPRVLGSLIALYEHKTVVEGIIWQINSFDQYGVELGKKIADLIHTAKNISEFDSSTQQLLKKMMSAD